MSRRDLQLSGEPADVAAFSGTPMALTAEAIGFSPIYRWYRAGGAAVPGGTNAILAWTSAEAADAGSYLLVISNAVGTVTSRVASVDGLGCASQQVRGGGRKGQPCSFVATNRVQYSYQWQRDGTNLSRTRSAMGRW